MGDITREPNARTKYGYFFQAVAERFSLVEVYDAKLSGLARVFNALGAFHPQPSRWRERFYKNIAAFHARSRRVATHLQQRHGQVDVALQVGVLFDAGWGQSLLPNVIYTDYTARLSAEKSAFGRSPFNAAQREKWIALERQAFQEAAHICTRSSYVKDSVVAHYGIPPEKVTVVGGGVNFGWLPQGLVRSNDDRPTVLFIGKEMYRKGGDLLLRAFAEVRRQVPGARLLFVTEGPIPAGLPLGGVQVISPTWDRAALVDLYRRADLFVLPSRLETWGDVLLEAMAYELPCIGVTGDSMEEIIQNEVTGLIVPANDVDTLAAALLRLLKDPYLRQQWGQAGRRVLENRYTWAGVVERLAPVLEAAAIRSLSNGKEKLLR